MSDTGAVRNGRGDVVLGLDAGTSSAKAVAVDRDGQIRAAAGSDPIATRSTPDGGREQVPEEVWQALASAGRRVAERMAPGTRVAALAVAAQSGSVIPVPVGGPAERVVTWMDTRWRSLVESWPRQVADRIRALSGWAPTCGVGLSTIAGLRADASRLRSGVGGTEVARWASADDYLVFRLTGRWATNPSNAAGMQLMEVSTCTWSPELCRVAGIDASVLSPILESGRVVGGLTGEAAEALALPVDTPVVVGGHDQACAALGLGAVEPGDLFLSAGTAWVLTVVTEQAEAGAVPSALNLSPHVLSGRWTASVNLGGLGALIAQSAPEGVRDAFASSALDVRDALDRAGEMAAVDGALIMVGGGARFRELAEMIAAAIDRPVVARPDATGRPVVARPDATDGPVVAHPDATDGPVVAHPDATDGPVVPSPAVAASSGERLEASWPAVGAARLAAAALGWSPLEGEA